MQSTKCWAPPSRRSSRSTDVTTTYFSPMSATVLARLSGSLASGGLGRPWATSQNEQRRVQTSPRIMKVAVPWPKHSWMLGQLASSQTVTRRFSRNLALSLATEPSLGIRTRIHEGLRNTGASANCTGERAILSPPICLTPVSSEGGAAVVTTCRGIRRARVSVMGLILSLRGRGRPHSKGESRRATRRPARDPATRVPPARPARTDGPAAPATPASLPPCPKARPGHPSR